MQKPDFTPAKIIPAVLSLLLFPAAFGSLAYATGGAVGYGIAGGAAAGALPLAALAMQNRLAIYKTLEWTTLLSLILISVVVSYQIFIPLIGKQSALLERSLPLLAVTMALYVFYILMSRLSADEHTQSVTGKLEAALSGPPLLLTLSAAVVLSTGILVAVHNLAAARPDLAFFTGKFLDRGPIPPLTILLFSWGLVMLLGKSYVLWREQRLLSKPARSLLIRAYRQTMYENANTTPEIYLDLIWKKSGDFYILPRYLNWAIPILGFIGTVFGISLASDGIQRIISNQQGLAQLSNELGKAISPLGIAFDTTLIALSLSIVLTLLQTMLQRWENNLLTIYENRILNLND